MILIFSVNTNRESVAYRSFSPSKFEARGARKVTTGILVRLSLTPHPDPVWGTLVDSSAMHLALGMLSSNPEVIPAKTRGASTLAKVQALPGAHWYGLSLLKTGGVPQNWLVAAKRS